MSKPEAETNLEFHQRPHNLSPAVLDSTNFEQSFANALYMAASRADRSRHCELHSASSEISARSASSVPTSRATSGSRAPWPKPATGSRRASTVSRGSKSPSSTIGPPLSASACTSQRSGPRACRPPSRLLLQQSRSAGSAGNTTVAPSARIPQRRACSRALRRFSLRSFSPRASPPSDSPARPRRTCSSARASHSQWLAPPTFFIATARCERIAIRSRIAATGDFWPLLAFGVFLGAAVLAKGPAAVLLAGGALGLWALATRQVARRIPPRASGGDRRMSAWSRSLGTRSVRLRNPDFLRVFILQHNFERYLTPMFQPSAAVLVFHPDRLSGAASVDRLALARRIRRTSALARKKLAQLRPAFSSPAGPSFPFCFSAFRSRNCRATFFRRFPPSRCFARSARPAPRTATRPF